MEYKSRKEERFNSIYQTYVDDIYKVSLYYTNDEYAAQEITQKAFYQLYIHLDNVQFESVRAYLIRTARNMAFNRTRNMRYELSRECFEDLKDDSITMHSVEDDYLHEEQKRQMKDLSDDILTRLFEENELWYEAIVLVYCLGKPQEQVAEELGISKDVLYSRLYRAKKWIRTNYEKEYREVIKTS